MIKPGGAVYVRALVAQILDGYAKLQIGEKYINVSLDRVFPEPRPFRKFDLVTNRNNDKTGMVIGVHDELLWVTWEDDTNSVVDTSEVEIDLIVSRRLNGD